MAHEATKCEKPTKLSKCLEKLDANAAEMRALWILYQLGLTPAMWHKKLKDFNVGRRTRVTLARVLFIQPFLLLLDKSTNQSDLDACVWLEEKLRVFLKHFLICRFHSQDFLNDICDSIIHMHNQKLKYYMDSYNWDGKTQPEVEENKTK